jgi:hypothetical protein
MRFFAGSHGILVKPLLVFVSVLSLSATPSAATSVVNCSTVTSTTELNSSVVCPQFNGVGLQSVEITVSGTITSTITLTNNGSSAQTGSGTTSSGYDVGALAGFTFSNPVFTASFSTGFQGGRMFAKPCDSPGLVATAAGGHRRKVSRLRLTPGV